MDAAQIEMIEFILWAVHWTQPGERLRPVRGDDAGLSRMGRRRLGDAIQVFPQRAGHPCRMSPAPHRTPLVVSREIRPVTRSADYVPCWRPVDGSIDAAPNTSRVQGVHGASLAALMHSDEEVAHAHQELRCLISDVLGEGGGAWLYPS